MLRHIAKWLAPVRGMEAQGRVLKSTLPGGFAFPTLFTAPGAKDNLIAWPIDPESLFTFYFASAEHSRAIHIKA